MAEKPEYGRLVHWARDEEFSISEEVENEFWAEVVQIAGNYNDKWPVEHWLSKIAKSQAITSYRRLHRRMKRVLYRAEMAAKRMIWRVWRTRMQLRNIGR